MKDLNGNGNGNGKDHSTLKKIVNALMDAFPGEKWEIQHVPREELEMDQYEIVKSRKIFGFHLPIFFGELVCLYCNGNCFVSYQSFLEIIKTVVPLARMDPQKKASTIT